MTKPSPWFWNLTGSAENAVNSLGQLLQRLADSGVDFVVVGGFAEASFTVLHSSLGTLISAPLPHRITWNFSARR